LWPTKTNFCPKEAILIAIGVDGVSGTESNMRLAFSILVSTFLLVVVTAAYADQFCDGFERGYSAGYKRASGSSLDPLTPLCPLQPLKRLNDPDSDFEHGYIIGFEQGIMAGQARRR
jgi:hypothetical protein